MTVRTQAGAKTERINLRASERQEALLRHAAQVSDTSMSEFILGSAVLQAERVMADRRWFVADPDQYDEFVRLLNTPIETPKLAALFAEESPFGRAIEVD